MLWSGLARRGGKKKKGGGPAVEVAVNLINSGYEPVLFLKLIGVGQTE